MAALSIVLQHAGWEICEDCEDLAEYQCPDPWFHEETSSCSDCEVIEEIREEHHANCAMRALRRLALTCSELARQGARKNYFNIQEIEAQESSAPAPPVLPSIS